MASKFGEQGTHHGSSPGGAQADHHARQEHQRQGFPRAGQRDRHAHHLRGHPRPAADHQARSKRRICTGGRCRRWPARSSRSFPSCAPVSAWWTACCAWSRPRVWATSACSATRRRSSPHVYFCKMPKDIAERDVMIVDPMLATGGSRRRGHRRDEEARLQATSSSWFSSPLPRASSMLTQEASRRRHLLPARSTIT